MNFEADNANFQTAKWVAEYMVSLVPHGTQYVFEPTPGQGNLVTALKSKEIYVFTPDDFGAANFWDIDFESMVIDWDYIVMNPPFSPMSEGYKILFQCMEKTNNLIALMPWLTIINSKRRTKAILDWGLVGVTHLPRDAFPGSRVQTCVLEMRYGFDSEEKYLRFATRPIDQ